MGNRSEKLPTLLDMALSYEDGNQGGIKPRTRVVVNTTRTWYGRNSTISTFLATAYDEQGGKIDSLKGYFLEPHVNYDSAKVANSDKAIMCGAYNIIPKEEIEKRINKERRERGEKDIQLTYKWYVDSVSGRSGIAIHAGNYGQDTEGCFLPGESYSYDKITKTYNVWNSKKKTKELFDFFDKYGHSGIKINVNSD